MLESANITDAITTMKPKQYGRIRADDILKYILFNENAWISIKISLKFIPEGLLDNKTALGLAMAWRRTQKSLFELMMTQVNAAYMCCPASMS